MCVRSLARLVCMRIVHVAFHSCVAGCILVASLLLLQKRSAAAGAAGPLPLVAGRRRGCHRGAVWLAAAAGAVGTKLAPTLRLSGGLGLRHICVGGQVSRQAGHHADCRRHASERGMASATRAAAADLPAAGGAAVALLAPAHRCH